MIPTPLPGQLYCHRKGGLYVIVCIASEEATQRPVVVYQSRQDGRYWTRPLEEFTDGRFWRAAEFTTTLVDILDR